jgi:DNA end-binding protein Ku
LAEEELKLADSLVAKRTCQDFDLARYKDEYAEKLAQLVDAKVQGRQLPAAKQDEPNPVYSLIEALQASVQQASPPANRNGSAKQLASQLKRNGQRKPRAVKTAVSRKRPRKKSA